MAYISNLALRLISTANLQAQQVNLATLNEQLASGHQHNDLTDYAPTAARQLMDFQNAIARRQSYIDAIHTVQTRLEIYDLTLTDMENIAAQAGQLATQNQTLSGSQVGSIEQQTISYVQQVITDLNQKIGDRYIYAGTRYSTQPVVDATSLLALATPTIPFVPTVDPNLPPYDSGYAGDPTEATAFIRDSVIIDDSNTLQYGITSVADGFQQLIAGLQLIYAATQTSNPTTYQTNMSAASTLLSTALTNIQTMHAGIANATNTLTQEEESQKTDIISLQNQISDVQQVDLTETATALNLLQTQLQASYSATANLTQLSILKYL